MVAEKNLISKLKLEAGVAYVTKMNAMMQDLDTSKGEIDSFKREKHFGKPNGIELNVLVLNNNWEIEKIKFAQLMIPQKLTNCLDVFTDFYTKRRQMHRLDWCLGLVFI